MTTVIQADSLVKTFGQTRALDGLDLSVNEGEVHAFLGPNGSGKSTTIRVLLGLLRMDSGTATLLGGDPWRDAATLHRQLAYVPGEVALWPNLTGGEVIDLLARLRGAANDEPAKARRANLIERFDLDPTKRCRSYSKGNRQKVALVAAFAQDVPLLILDEPTSGLDPLMEQVFRNCVDEARERGCTVLLSSHILSEVEVLCDRVTILRSGKTVQTGSLSDLRRQTRTEVSAEVRDEPVCFDSIGGVHDVQIDGHRVTCSVEPDALAPLLDRLQQLGIRSLTSSPPSLERLFMDYYGEAN
jgi:polyether ionophore transport system ATP-binding protein